MAIAARCYSEWTAISAQRVRSPDTDLSSESAAIEGEIEPSEHERRPDRRQSDAVIRLELGRLVLAGFRSAPRRNCMIIAVLGMASSSTPAIPANRIATPSGICPLKPRKLTFTRCPFCRTKTSNRASTQRRQSALRATFQPVIRAHLDAQESLPRLNQHCWPTSRRVWVVSSCFPTSAPVNTFLQSPISCVGAANPWSCRRPFRAWPQRCPAPLRSCSSRARSSPWPRRCGAPPYLRPQDPHCLNDSRGLLGLAGHLIRLCTHREHLPSFVSPTAAIGPGIPSSVPPGVDVAPGAKRPTVRNATRALIGKDWMDLTA